MKSRKKTLFQGSMVALVTPFQGGEIDEKALKALLDMHLKAKTDVIIPCGTTGESATLSHEEHKRLMSFVVDYVAGRAPVVCGAGSNNTREAIELVQYAEKAGADGVLVVTPYYNKPTQEGLYRHYEFLLRESNIPVVLYNVPGRTGISLQPETVARLSKFPNVAAIKEASGNLDQVDQILTLCDLPVLSGDDSLTLPMMSIGAKGVISVTANIVPDRVRAMVHAALEGRWDKALALHRKLYPLSKNLFIESNPIPVKTALGLMKKISPELRLPLCPMNPKNLEVLKKTLQETEVIG
jgi:4-hydroxy-tetrahydrodipicolinate synthase